MSTVNYYIMPALMGGAAQTMITQLIDFNIETQLNWGLAAALSVVLLFITLFLLRRVQRGIRSGPSPRPFSRFRQRTWR